MRAWGPRSGFSGSCVIWYIFLQSTCYDHRRKFHKELQLLLLLRDGGADATRAHRPSPRTSTYHNSLIGEHTWPNTDTKYTLYFMTHCKWCKWSSGVGYTTRHRDCRIRSSYRIIFSNISRWAGQWSKERRGRPWQQQRQITIEGGTLEETVWAAELSYIITTSFSADTCWLSSNIIIIMMISRNIRRRLEQQLSCEQNQHQQQHHTIYLGDRESQPFASRQSALSNHVLCGACGVDSVRYFRASGMPERGNNLSSDDVA